MRKSVKSRKPRKSRKSRKSRKFRKMSKSKKSRKSRKPRKMSKSKKARKMINDYNIGKVYEAPPIKYPEKQGKLKQLLGPFYPEKLLQVPRPSMPSPAVNFATYYPPVKSEIPEKLLQVPRPRYNIIRKPGTLTYATAIEKPYPELQQAVFLNNNISYNKPKTRQHDRSNKVASLISDFDEKLREDSIDKLQDLKDELEKYYKYEPDIRLDQDEAFLKEIYDRYLPNVISELEKNNEKYNIKDIDKIYKYIDEINEYRRGIFNNWNYYPSKIEDPKL
jgi:hypothetical protein